MPIRLATPADIEPLGELLRLMHQEIGIGRVNEAKARVAVTNIVSKGQCILALRGDKIVGSIGLDYGQFWYSTDDMLKDSWFFIHPDHRADVNESGENAGHASKLLATAKELANIKGIPLVVEMASQVDTALKLRWFRKHMQQFGGAFIHVPASYKAKAA